MVDQNAEAVCIESIILSFWLECTAFFRSRQIRGCVFMLTLTVYIRSLFHIVFPPPLLSLSFTFVDIVFFCLLLFFAKFLKFLACFIFSAIIRVVLVLLTLRSQSPTQSGYDYVVMHNFIRIIHKRQKKLFPFLLPSSSPLCVYYYGTKHFVIFAIKTNGR